jgi:hypothetical protein
MMQASAIYSQCVPVTPQKALLYTRHRNKLHVLSWNHIKLHICLKYLHYLNNPITLSTHPKQQQRAEHQPKSCDKIICFTTLLISLQNLQIFIFLSLAEALDVDPLMAVESGQWAAFWGGEAIGII